MEENLKLEIWCLACLGSLNDLPLILGKGERHCLTFQLQGFFPPRTSFGSPSQERWFFIIISYFKKFSCRHVAIFQLWAPVSCTNQCKQNSCLQVSLIITCSSCREEGSRDFWNKCLVRLDSGVKHRNSLCKEYLEVFWKPLRQLCS